MPRRTIVLLTLCALLLGTWAGASLRARPGQSGPREPQLLPQPYDWVPFSADVTVESPTDGRQTGRFFRRADGSTRLEITWLQHNATVISINNVSATTYYRYSPKRGWVSGPMELPTWGWKPLRYHDQVFGLRPYRHRVALKKGQSGSLWAVEGFDAFMYTTGAGGLRIMIPELNFFPAVRQSLYGRRETYSNIEIGPQPSELFELPPGAHVTAIDLPGGIVRSHRIAQSPE